MLTKPIPKKMRDQMAQDPYYYRCARFDALGDHECCGDPMGHKMIEWEHALYYAGSRINEPWAIVPICWLTHRGGLLDKEKNEWLAINRGTPEDFARYPRFDWEKRKAYLNGKYGIPNFSTNSAPF